MTAVALAVGAVAGGVFALNNKRRNEPRRTAPVGPAMLAAAAVAVGLARLA